MCGGRGPGEGFEALPVGEDYNLVSAFPGEEDSSALPSLHYWGANRSPRFQGSRLDDQRCAPPAATKGPTVPDEDFFSLILRSQAKRMDEQRVLLQRDQNRDAAFGLKGCLQSDALLEFKNSGRK